MAEIRAGIAATVGQVSVEEGQLVAEGDELCVLESSTVEVSVTTEVPGVVRELYVQPGDRIREGDAIALIDES